MTPDDDFESRFEAFTAKTQEPAPVEPVAGEQEGTPAPAAEQTAPVETQTEVPAEPFPGYLSLSEEIRAAIDAQLQARDNQLKEAAQRFNMLHGQVAPLQREVAALKRPPKPEPRTPEPRTEPPTAGKWAALKSTLGPDAEAIEELLESRIAEIRERDLKPVSEKLSQLDKLAAITERDETREAISEAHDDWESCLASDDFQDWCKYLKGSNPRMHAKIKDGLERGGADEHIFALDLYKTHMDVLQASKAPAPAPRIRTPDPTPRAGRAPVASSTSQPHRTGDAFEDRWNDFLSKK